ARARRSRTEKHQEGFLAPRSLDDPRGGTRRVVKRPLQHPASANWLPWQDARLPRPETGPSGRQTPPQPRLVIFQIGGQAAAWPPSPWQSCNEGRSSERASASVDGDVLFEALDAQLVGIVRGASR